jgi:hypothetical protein
MSPYIKKSRHFLIFSITMLSLISDKFIRSFEMNVNINISLIQFFYILLILTFCFNHSYSAEVFGNYGHHGSHGYAGQHGYHGESVIIDANTTLQEFNLSGGHATAGGNGENGGNATSCDQEKGEYDLVGASGGDAGDGGQGGDGGNGGDALVYYQNSEDLKNIKIINPGGRGASSGSAGSMGGYGCRCSLNSWSIESCYTNEEDERICSSTSYSCEDGSNGKSGNSPSEGSNGSYGTIRLVKDLDALPQENYRVNTNVAELSKNTFNMSKIIWKSQSDGKKLFHPNSNISGGYSEYVKLSEKKFELEWDVKRSIEPFLKTTARLHFNGEKTNIEIENNHFLIGRYDYSDPNVDRFRITQAYLKNELDQLTLNNPIGERDNFTVKITDNVSLSKVVKNRVYLTVTANRFILSDKELFSGYVPNEFIKVEDDSITLLVGKLPTIDTARLRATRNVSLNIRIDRSIEEQSIQKNLQLNNFKIPKI